MTIRVMAQSRKQGEQPPAHSGEGSSIRSIARSLFSIRSHTESGGL